MHAKFSAGIVAVALLAAAAAVGEPARAPEVPALWAPHALIVDLDDLPKTYTCDELWYRFRAVLLELGARANSLNIMPYHCAGRSPSVEVQFALPEALPSARASVADFSARSVTLSISAGHPSPLDPADCELVRRMRDELLPELPVRVVSFEAHCGDSRPARRQFSLQVQAYEPEGINAPSAAGAPAASLPPAAHGAR